MVFWKMFNIRCSKMNCTPIEWSGFDSVSFEQWIWIFFFEWNIDRSEPATTAMIHSFWQLLHSFYTRNNQHISIQRMDRFSNIQQSFDVVRWNCWPLFSPFSFIFKNIVYYLGIIRMVYKKRSNLRLVFWWIHIWNNDLFGLRAQLLWLLCRWMGMTLRWVPLIFGHFWN